MFEFLFRRPSLSFFLICHDMEIVRILEPKLAKAYASKGVNYRWLLVGTGHDHATGGIDPEKIVVVERLADNIEVSNRHWLQFTGWHALAHNGLIKTRYVGILEYDAFLTSSFSHFKLTADLYALLKSVKLDLFVEKPPYTTGLDEFIREERGVDSRTWLDRSGLKSWICTSNVIWKTERFLEFMNSPLYRKFLGRFGEDKYAPHFVERFLTYYAHEKCLTYEFLGNNKWLKHHYLDSHQTYKEERKDVLGTLRDVRIP